jgi:hypothetical protein
MIKRISIEEEFFDSWQKMRRPRMIRVTPEALKLILKKGGNITVFIKEVEGCCGVDRFPVVYRGNPSAKAKGRFEQVPVNGVAIWKAENVTADPNGDGIQIGVKRLLWFKRFSVQGVAT